MDWLLVGAGALLTLGTALFVAAEFSFVTLDPAAVEKQLGPDRASQRVRKALHSLSTQLSSAQVGITITTILLGYITSPAVTRLLSSLFGAVPPSWGIAVATFGTFILVNGFSMVFGELVPKNLALAAPLRTAKMTAGPQMAFTTALKPLILLLNNTANALLRLVGVEPKEELAGGRSPAELAALVRRSADEGTLDLGTALLITNSLDFADLSAVDAMTDRLRVATIKRDETALDVIALTQSTGHSRFPVIGDSADDVVGLVHLKRAVAVPVERRSEVPVAALMTEAPRVPETVGLESLLVTLREAGLQMAIVVDEYGGTSGVVTLEDVIEELVGEVADEHDPTRHLVRAEADSYLVPGILRPDELTELTGLVVPEEGPYETLAGLVMAELGRIAQVGDEVTVAGCRLEVTSMKGRRILQLRVRQVAE